jgi:tape measure domain-containing protein
LATQFAVDLVFKSQTQQLDAAVNKINKFERDLARLKGADPFQGVEDSARQAGQEIDRTKSKAESAGGSFNKLGAVLGKLALAYAAIQATKYVFGKAAEIESQTRSIQVLTGSLQKAQGIIKQLQQYANVTPFTSTEVIETAKKLTAFGVEADKVVETTKRLGDIAGATGANLGELSLAYGQVMAKGRLQGEELLQFQERGVALQEELKRMYGLSGEEFSEALRKGQFSAEAVEVAVKRLTDAGGKYANGAISQSDTLAGKLSTLQDAFENLARNIGKFFEPVFKWMLDSVTKIINRLNDATVMQDEWRARSEADQRTRNRFGARALNPFDAEVNAYRKALEESLYATNRGGRAAAGGISAAPTPSASSSALPKLLADEEKQKKGSQKKLQDEQEKIDRELAKNRIELDNQVFKNQQELIKQRYDLEAELAEKMAGIWANGFQGAGRDQANAINQLIKSSEDFGKRVNDLKMQIAAQQQAVKAAQAGVGVAGMTGGGGRVGQPIEYLTGDRRSSGYRADHGGGNYHEHIAYKTAQEARAAAELLNRNGIKTTELKGVNSVGRHSPNSYHYSGQAFDVPAAQVPVGQEQALSARVRQLLGIGGGGGVGSSGAVVGAQGDVATAKEELAGLNQQLEQLLATQQQFQQVDMAAFIQQSTDAFKGETDSLVKQTEALQLKNRLEMEGVNPAVIEGELQKLQVSQQLTERQDALKQALEAGIITNEQYAAALEAVNAAAQGTAAAIDNYTQVASASQSKIAQHINKLRTELNDTEGMIVSLAGTIEGEIGSAMSNAITGLIDGTMTAEQAFSQMFKNIGKAFIDMATQMIAKALVMKVLGIAFGGGGGSSIVPGFDVPIGSMPAGMAFASGGPVSPGGTYLVGENGPEILSLNSGGGGYIQNSSATHASMMDSYPSQSRQPAQPMAPVDVNYNVTDINGMRFVTEEQFQVGMSEAANKGAQNGYNLTLKRLAHAPSARRRIGI